MTLNGHFALKSVSGSATNGLASPAFGQNCSKFAELPIYCQRQKCSPWNVLSGSIRFVQIFAGSLCLPHSLWWSVKWECGRWKWQFSLLSFTVFWTFYIHGHTTVFTWCDCWWPCLCLKVIRLFHIKFLENGAWYGKSYYRLLIGSHTRMTSY